MEIVPWILVGVRFILPAFEVLMPGSLIVRDVSSQSVRTAFHRDLFTKLLSLCDERNGPPVVYGNGLHLLCRSIANLRSRLWAGTPAGKAIPLSQYTIPCQANVTKV